MWKIVCVIITITSWNMCQSNRLHTLKKRERKIFFCAHSVGSGDDGTMHCRFAILLTLYDHAEQRNGKQKKNNESHCVNLRLNKPSSCEKQQKKLY